MKFLICVNDSDGFKLFKSTTYNFMNELKDKLYLTGKA
jgi:hypothetical protein